MEVLFWNIGNSLDEDKKQIVARLLKSRNFDVVCFAEGTISKEKCAELELLLTSLSFRVYYSPSFVFKDNLSLNYGFERNGLKVFYKKSVILKEDFSFELQRVNGRIVIFRFFINFALHQLVFVHNYSKKGSRETNAEQMRFMGKLSDMFEIGKISKDIPQTCILGDFNLEPWDTVMREKKYIETCFLERYDKMNQRKESTIDVYYNPILDTINGSRIENLGGTYYSDRNGWALFDYPIYPSSKIDVTFEIITEFDKGSFILDRDLKKTAKFINFGFDHLPVLLKIH